MTVTKPTGPEKMSVKLPLAKFRSSLLIKMAVSSAYPSAEFGTLFLVHPAPCGNRRDVCENRKLLRNTHILISKTTHL